MLLASLGIYYASTTSAAVTDVPVGSQNISLNKRSWASSRVYNHVPGNAFDRKNETRWNSANADRQWICVNLGATQRVDKVLIDWYPGAHAKTWALQTNPDGTKWITQHVRSNGTGGVEGFDLPSGTMAKYVCLWGLERSNVNAGFGIREIGVWQYGTGSASPTNVSTPTATPTPIATKTPTPTPTPASERTSDGKPIPYNPFN